jgi:glyoxylase-like metal-dependent hydrolase (beta-lactamase superfamily II)
MIKRWQIGAVRVTCIAEIAAHVMPADVLLADVNAAKILEHSEFRPDHATESGDIIIAFQCFVIESNGRRIMVDTCIGNDKQRHEAVMHQLATPFLEDLTAAGFAPDSIDWVLCTHLHADHVGWNTRLVDGVWIPTFRNARYLFAEAEFRFWESQPQAAFGDVFGDSIKPIVDAGLCDLIPMDHAIDSNVRLVPTPGHTHSHVSVSIESDGERALISGDMVHHPIQLKIPSICTNFCSDPEKARATRVTILPHLAETGTLLIGSHFSGTVAGHVAREGDGYTLKA